MTGLGAGVGALAVVAGASGTIGLHVVRALLAAGCDVVATGRRPPTGLAGLEWAPLPGDIENGDAAFATALAARPLPLRVVVSCVGAASSKNLIAETEPAEFAELFAANVTSVVRLWHAVSDRARAGRASVVLVSSDATATVRSQNGAYTAAKAALEALGRTLAAEEQQHGVRVNMIAPSLVASAMAVRVLEAKGVSDLGAYYEGLPWGRPLDPGEVAAAIAELALNPSWSYASGQLFRLAVREPL